ncbi:MAG: FCD domain-containing protein [Arachnia sp.]
MPRDRAPQRLRQTIDAIKELILEQGLKPGDAMPTEAHLADLLGVSRANLREAIRTLATLDIIEVHHGTGMFVGPMSLRPLVEGLTFKGVVLPGKDFQTLRQVVEVRQALDLAISPSVVAHLRGTEHAELDELCTAMAEHSDKGETFGVEDRCFHLTVANMVGNELYGQLVAAFWDVYTLVAPRLGVATPRDLADTVRAHRDMLDAAIAGDLETYKAAVEAHYAPLLRVLDATPVPAQAAD